MNWDEGFFVPAGYPNGYYRYPYQGVQALERYEVSLYISDSRFAPNYVKKCTMADPNAEWTDPID